MNRLFLILAVVSFILVSVVCRPSSVFADAGYGRGPESDPIAMAAIANMVISNTAGTNITVAVATLQGQMTTTTGNVATIQGTLATTTGNVAVIQGTLATATGNVATLQGEIIALADTNITTTATTHTPRFIGDVLLGGAGSGTNAVWVAKGATTNDWVAIKP